MKIFLIGFMGSGKTTIAQLLSEKFCFDFMDTDKAIEEAHNMSISDIFQKIGESYFRETEMKLLSEISVKRNIVVSTGGGLPCFANNIATMNNIGKTVYLHAGIDTLFNRLNAAQNKRPLLKNIESNELKHYISDKLTERETYYNKASLIVHTDNYIPQQVVEIIYNNYAPKTIL